MRWHLKLVAQASGPGTLGTKLTHGEHRTKYPRHQAYTSVTLLKDEGESRKKRKIFCHAEADMLYRLGRPGAVPRAQLFDFVYLVRDFHVYECHQP